MGLVKQAILPLPQLSLQIFLLEIRGQKLFRYFTLLYPVVGKWYKFEFYLFTDICFDFNYRWVKSNRCATFPILFLNAASFWDFSHKLWCVSSFRNDHFDIEKHLPWFFQKQQTMNVFIWYIWYSFWNKTFFLVPIIGQRAYYIFNSFFAMNAVLCSPKTVFYHSKLWEFRCND